ncbi:MAG: hypothetical protein QOH06_2766 [Acidobacteriota bacterium]|jgi:hypothetical protein|nr:hypothetical protein [Acidobacteriota bacterium]
MSKETTYAGMLGAWLRWVSALLANGSDLGHLTVPREQLGTLAARGQELIQTQSQLTAAKQDASQELGEVMVEGQRLMTVLKFAVKQHYGIDSEKLAEFGLQPFRSRRRSKAAEPPPPLPE